MTSTCSRPDLEEISRSALVEVLGGLLGVPSQEVKAATDDGRDPEGPMRCVVDLRGTRIRGALVVSIPRAFAAEAARRLTGASSPDSLGPGLLADCAGELGNMLAGRVATRLRLEGHACELGIPQVVLRTEAPTPGAAAAWSLSQTSPRTPSGSPGTHVCRTHWSCQGHGLTLEIHLGYLTT